MESRAEPSELGAPPPSAHLARTGLLDVWSVSAVAVLALALWLRLFGLGGQPLSPREAETALESWRFYRGSGATAEAGPLLVYGQALVFLLFGATDGSARLIPALAGAALVALPLLVQRELGRLGARMACLLLAISPSLVFLSRQVDGASLAAGLTFAAIVLYHVALRDLSRSALLGAVAAMALLFTAGPLGYYGLAAIGGYLLLRAGLGRTTSGTAQAGLGFSGAAERRLVGAPLLPTPLRAALGSTRVLLVFLVVWVLATTGLLADLRGVQHGLVGGLGGWLRSLVEPSDRPATFYLAVLASYEQAPLAFGLLGAFTMRRDALAGKLTSWALAILILGSLGQDRPIGLAAQIAIPLSALAGAQAERLVRSLRDPEARRGLAQFAAASTIILAGLGIALGVFSMPDPPVTEALLIIPILVGTAALAVSVVRLGSSTTWRHLLAVGLVVSLLWGFRETSLLSLPARANPAELIAEATTSPDIRQLASDVVEIGDTAEIGRHERGVLVSPDLPATVSWYLRDAPSMRVGEALSSDTMIVVLPADVGAPVGFVGQRYQLGVSEDVAIDGWKSLWRWYAYREAPELGQSSDAVVYVKPVG